MARIGAKAKALRWARERALAIRRAPLPWIAAAIIVTGLAVDTIRHRPLGSNAPRVLVARHEVPPGQPVTAIDFAARPLASVPPGALTDQDIHRLRGYRTVRPLEAGEPLVRSAVASAVATPLGRRLPFGSRAYALERAAGLPFEVGDRVDVLGGVGERTTRVAENLPVIAVSDDGAPIAAVPDGVVRLLEETRRRGGMTLVLRRPDEPPSRPVRLRAKPVSVPVVEGDR